jgi:outer membrane receptor for ferrienterochelin and colicin
LRANVQGNPDLKMVQINNYDLRFERYFKTGDNLSVSAFYKEFKNHIELINHGSGRDGTGARWINSPNNSWLYGLEIEGRKVISKQLEFMANVTLVSSYSKVNTGYTQDNGLPVKGDTVSHTMFGQSPYIINGILSYNAEKMGFSATLSYNVQGPRLVIIGQHGASYVPDIYEMPRNLLDFKASKSAGKHFAVSIKVLDILNSSVKRTYKFPEGYILDYDKYTWGTTYIFSISYKL